MSPFSLALGTGLLRRGGFDDGIPHPVWGAPNVCGPGRQRKYLLCLTLYIDESYAIVSGRSVAAQSMIERTRLANSAGS